MRAWIFPGQGTQFVGMGVALRERFPEARALFELADRVLGLPLTQIMTDGPVERLTETEVTQPAVLTHSLAVLAVLRARGLAPEATAGYSLGEYGALVAAGVLQPAEAIELVRDRARAMVQARAMDPRSMAVLLGPSAAELAPLLARCPADELVTVAGYCTPQLFSLSGTPGGLEWLGRELERVGSHAQLRPVPVTLPFHSRLLAGAQQTLRQRLASVPFRPPRCPVVVNVTGEPVDDPQRLRELLIEQVVQPVRWVETVHTLRRLGVDEVWELGPGKSLTGYLRKIDPTVKRLNLEDPLAVDGVLLSAGLGG